MVLMAIELRSIDFVPEHERHGRVQDQGPFWFLSNFHFFAIAIGFVGPSLGLSLGATALAGALGIVIGTAFQAFHASQGAEMGLPQMIQSRAQFGYRRVIVPLLGTLVSLVGYNVVSTVLVSAGAHALWGVNRNAVAIGMSLLAAVLAIWGYDWLHRVFRILFWISLPLFSILTLAIVTGKAGGIPHAAAGFSWAAFVTQMASAASFNITAAPYVSDYSRYLPTRTPRAQIILNVFAGSALSARFLDGAAAFLPSAQEVGPLLRSYEPEALALDLHQAGIPEVVLKRGAEPVVLADRGAVHSISVAATPVVDPTGAGDSFCGAYAACRLLGHDPFEAARRAAATAALIVGCSGVEAALTLSTPNFPTR